MQACLRLVAAYEGSYVQYARHYLGVRFAVVGTYHQADVLGAATLEFAVCEAPEGVLHAVPSHAHIGSAMAFEEFVPRLPAIEHRAGRLTAPEVRDGVSYHEYLGVSLMVAAYDAVVALYPVVSVAPLCAWCVMAHSVGTHHSLVQNACISPLILEHTYIVEVIALYKVVGIKAQVGTGHIIESLHALGLQFLHNTLLHAVLLHLPTVASRMHQCRRMVDELVLGEYDGSFASLAQAVDAVAQAFLKLLAGECGTVGHTIYNVRTRVYLCQSVKHDVLHLAAARESEVDHRAFVAPLQSCAPDETRPAGRCSMGYAGAIYHDGALLGAFYKPEGGRCVGAHSQPLHAVIHGKIEFVGHSLSPEVGQLMGVKVELHGIRLVDRHVVAHHVGHPGGVSVHVCGIEVDARVAQSDHVGVVLALIIVDVSHPQLLGIGLEAQRYARCVP